MERRQQKMQEWDERQRLGIDITRLKNELELNGTEVAQRSGVSQQHVRRALTNPGSVTVEKLTKILTALQQSAATDQAAETA